MRQTAESLRLNKKAQSLFSDYASRIPVIDKDRNYRADQLEGYLDNFRIAMRKKNLKWLREKRGFKCVPVDVITHAEHEYFLGQDGWESSNETLWKVFHEDPEPDEVVLTGSTGTGKSWVGYQIIGYINYLLNCLHNPQLEFGLSKNSSIFLVFQSMRQDTANDSLFDPLHQAITHSPYYSDHCPRRKDKEKVNTSLIFHNNVHIVNLTGALTSAIGKNLFAIVITEANFMKKTKNSVFLADSNKEILDQAAEMHATAKNRSSDRFKLEDGTIPGLVVVDTARNYVGDFTDQRIDRAKADPNHIVETDLESTFIRGNGILAISRTLWGAKKHKYPATESRFIVERATDIRPARILKKREDAEDPNNIFTVPVRHLPEFEEDIEGAARDLAGEPSTKTGRFIPFPEKISAAQQRWVDKYPDAGGKGLFRVNDISLAEFFAEGFDPDRLINKEFIKRITPEGEFNWSAHLDTALSGDACGLALGRVVDSVSLAKASYWNATEGRERTIEGVRAAIYQVDGILRIYAKPGEQIDINIIRDLVLELNALLPGCVKYGTADWMESAATLSAWRVAGISANFLSVDGRGGKPPVDFFELKHATKEERLIVVPHEYADREWRRLIRIIQGGRVKVDHPPGESKDCIDGVTGVVGVLHRCEGRKEKLATPAEEGEGEEGLREQNELDRARQGGAKMYGRKRGGNFSTMRTRRGVGGLGRRRW